MLTLLYPLSKGAGPLYRFFVFRRIYPWYRVLRELEDELALSNTPDERATIVGQIHELEQAVVEIHVPARYAGEVFALRRNIAAVLRRANETVSVAFPEV